MNSCTKAIIAVAGYGTRRLPIVKAVDKCMLPLLNRPVIDYAVQDCIAAGVKDIYFVVSGDARQLRDYYERKPILEQYLRSKGKTAALESIMPPKDVVFHYVSQDLSDGRYGTTIPVWLCRDYVEADELVLVIMGDQALYRTDGGSEAADLVEAVAQSEADGGLIGVPVPKEQIRNYGIIEADGNGKYERIIEHPQPGDTESNLNNASMYLVPGSFFEVLDEQVESEQMSEGEYLIIDAINTYVHDGHSFRVVTAKGEYLDCGSLENWVKANSWLLQQMQS